MTNFNEWLNNLDKDKKTALNISRKNIDKCLKEHSENLYYLKQRWNDEREYEDFDEYVKIFRDTFKDYGFKNVKLTKSFKITINHLGWETQFRLNFNGISFKYKCYL